MNRAAGRIRVMIVEDSRVVREYLRHLVDQDPRLEVVAAVETAEEALRLLERVKPDVISMDIRLPGMNGFEATQRIMSQHPTPVVVVSASIESEDLKITMNALRAGALTVVEKPVDTTHEAYSSMARRLCNQLANMSQVRVVAQRIDRGLRFGRDGAAPRRTAPRRPLAGPFAMVGIVASTGGPPALARLLESLPAHFPLPILVVQHIWPTFLEGFVRWLDDISPFRAVTAGGGERPEPGTVYVAPGHRHLVLRGGRLALDDGPAISGQRPSGTVLLASMARDLGPRAVGVLLTGMGTDGAAGLLELFQAGAHTIAEDASTAVVYGMPGEAVRLGAVVESLPVHDIAPRLVELAGGGG